MLFPFQIIHAPANEAEYQITGFLPGQGREFPICNAKDPKNGLIYSVRAGKNHTWIVKILNSTQQPVTGNWGIRRNWTFAPNSYTLVPGVFYNGNYQPRVQEIPTLHLPESPRYDLPLSAASMPAVLYGNFEDPEQGFAWFVSPLSLAGWNGVSFDATEETVTVYLPAREDQVYRYGKPESYGRLPFTLQPQQALSIQVEALPLPARTPGEVFDFLWENRTRPVAGLPPYCTGAKLDIDEAAQLIGDWMLKKHFVRGCNQEPMLLNAFMDINRPPEPVQELAEWNIMIGWCSGPMTALPLLKLSPESRERAIEYLDFLCSDGFFATGLKKPIFDGTRWIALDEKPKYADYEHARFYGDFAVYLGRAIRYEKSLGNTHLLWEKVFQQQIDIFINLWEKHHDFGMYWTNADQEITLRNRGTAAGAFPFLALTESYLQNPDSEVLQKVIPEIADCYAQRCLTPARINGGPLDIREADDSESAAALTNAYVNCYKVTGEERMLNYALQSAKIFASWVMAYRPPLPSGILAGKSGCQRRRNCQCAEPPCGTGNLYQFRTVPERACQIFRRYKMGRIV